MDYDLENSSECSSGCESGWTMYLDNSSFSPYESQKRNGIVDCEKKGADHDFVINDDDEEEDMSMVSDASSGPPHFQEEEDEEVYLKSNKYHAPIHDATFHKRSGKMKKKTKENLTRKILEQPSFLDDTASSSVFNFSNNNYAVSNDYVPADNLSQGYSTTHFEGKSGYYHHQQGHCDYCHSTISGNNVQQNQWFQERRWL